MNLAPAPCPPLARSAAIAAACWLAAAAAGAQQGPKLVPAGSEIVFVTRQLGVPVEGRFTRFSAQITFDPAQPEAGRVVLDVDTRSATLGTPELDSELPKPGWLDSAKQGQAHFESQRIRVLGKGRFEAAGRLTIKSATRDVAVPVALAPAPGGAVASGSFVLKRLDFRIGDGEWSDTSVLADDVQVKFRLVVEGLSP